MSLSPVFPQVDSVNGELRVTDHEALKRSDAEIFAGRTPVDSEYAWPPEHLFRFFSYSQISSWLAQDGLQDHTSGIQDANDFHEGRIVSGTGGGPHPGCTLRFPIGLGNIVGSLRVGSMVTWRGDQWFGTCLSWAGTAYTGASIILGPGASGFFPSDGSYANSAALEQLRISLDPNNIQTAVITTDGSHQGSRIRRVKVEGFNGRCVYLGDTGGPAYFLIDDFEASGGTTNIATAREGIYSDMGSIVRADDISIESGASNKVAIAVHLHNGSFQGRNHHYENCTTGVYLDTGGTNACVQMVGISGNATCDQLIWIPSGYTGTLTAEAINNRTGDPSKPIGIRNDNTGEQILDVMHGLYVWSGTAKDISRIHNGMVMVPRTVVTYSASMTPNCALGGFFTITATNATAFTINAPTSPLPNQRISINIINSSGGGLGAATWNAVFKLAAWTQPATGFSRVINFVYNGSQWVEESRTTADVPN